jgi:prolipoprotein diacylglyceryl transferase
MRPYAYIPSPSQGVWHLGPLPLRAYAFCIILGVFVAVLIADRRWRARGGHSATVNQIATWAVPFGLVGGRLYHIVTDPELYFEHGNDWVHVFYVWNGGLGIWGAIALGAVGAYIGCRRANASFPAFADSAAPGIVLAQAIGRFGNYFNQELYGKPTTMPWGLKIDSNHAVNGVAGIYQPTFLYESLWDVGTALLVLWADRRYRLGHGRAFFLYVMAYTAGRGWIEYLRVDHANHILGLRLNDWTSILVFLFALIGFVISARRHPGREEIVEFSAARQGSEQASEPGSGPGSEPGSEPGSQLASDQADTGRRAAVPDLADEGPQ